MQLLEFFIVENAGKIKNVYNVKKRDKNKDHFYFYAPAPYQLPLLTADITFPYKVIKISLFNLLSRIK